MVRARKRRLHGLTLVGLLLVQGIAMPLGACERSHEEQAPTPAMAAGHHSNGDEMPAGTHDSAPEDCVALSGCGVPAMSVKRCGEITIADLQSVQVDCFVSDGPAAVDLGTATPPPKIWAS